MSILDKFKKTKSVEPEAQIEKAAESLVTEAVAEAESGSARHIPDVLVKPLLSEKAMSLAGTGRYVFIVSGKAQKPEIKKSIQRIYSVHVEDVKIVNLPAKKRQSRGRVSHTSAVKKAIVILKEGEKIQGIIESVG